MSESSSLTLPCPACDQDIVIDLTPRKHTIRRKDVVLEVEWMNESDHLHGTEIDA